MRILSRGFERPIPADSFGFCVYRSLTRKYVSVPAVSVGTFDRKKFLDLPIKLNHNEAGAKYEINNGVMG